MKRDTPRRGIAILGGTFDPIHFGHLRPAEEVRQALGIEQVLLVPAGQPPHRRQPHADAAHRLTMTQLAAAPHPVFTVLDWEVRKVSPSYAVETLARLRVEHGDTPLCFILGTDAFLRFDTWHHWREILDLVHLVVTCRPGWNNPELPEVLKLEVQARQMETPAALLARPAGGILFQAVTALSISATQIRDLVAQGASPRFLLPDAVLAYIGQHDLYRCERGSLPGDA